MSDLTKVVSLSVRPQEDAPMAKLLNLLDRCSVLDKSEIYYDPNRTEFVFNITLEGVLEQDRFKQFWALMFGKGADSCPSGIKIRERV